jgi:cell division septal protein FtsQ
MKIGRNRRKRVKRVDPVKPARRVQFRHFPGIALSLILLSLLTYLLGWSSLLSLKSISITGSSAPALISDSISSSHPPIHIGLPLARINVASLSRRILKNEWIASAQIGRSWIHGTLTVVIHERKPVASYQDGNGVARYFDIHGVDFQSPAQYPNVPAIQLIPSDPHSSSSLTSSSNETSLALKSTVAALLTELNTIDPALLRSAQGFTLAGRDSLSMKSAITPTRIVTIQWGSPSDLSLKVDVLRKLLARKENAKASIFDLSQPLSPITK